VEILQSKILPALDAGGGTIAGLARMRLPCAYGQLAKRFWLFGSGGDIYKKNAGKSRSKHGVKPYFFLYLISYKQLKLFAFWCIWAFGGKLLKNYWRKKS